MFQNNQDGRFEVLNNQDGRFIPVLNNQPGSANRAL
jgi:hypothetical protein